jgi:hypothetical protein
MKASTSDTAVAAATGLIRCCTGFPVTADETAMKVRTKRPVRGLARTTDITRVAAATAFGTAETVSVVVSATNGLNDIDSKPTVSKKT